MIILVGVAMSNIKLNTEELNQRVIQLSSFMSELNDTLDKIEAKLKSLSYANQTWYSSTTIALYDHFNERAIKIRQLQDSCKQFFQSTNEIIEEYERLEEIIVKKADDISSIHIV